MFTVTDDVEKYNQMLKKANKYKKIKNNLLE